MTATLSHTHNGRPARPPERFTSRDPDALPGPDAVARRTGGSRRSASCASSSRRSSPTTRIAGDVDAPDGAHVGSIEPRQPPSARCSRRPTGSARWRWRHAPRRSCCASPAGAEARRADRASPARVAAGARLRAPGRRGRRQTPRPRSSSTTAARPGRREHRDHRRRRRQARTGQRPGLGRRRGPHQRARRAGWAATRNSGTSSSISAARSCASSRRCSFAGPGGRAELLGVWFAGAGQHFGVAALRRPQPAQLHVERAVQERAAGRRRAHGVDRRRPDPPGTPPARARTR